MPFEIVRNDITHMIVDALVNTANPQPVIGLGTDSRIHEKAGPGLLAARQSIGCIAVGTAAITPAFDLRAKYVIHTVGPVWKGGSCGEENKLRNCYEQSLQLAADHGCQSIAFPLISTGNYGFPKDKALQIAISAFSAFLLEHEMQIYLVVFDRTAFQLSEKLFQSVSSYIDELVWVQVVITHDFEIPLWIGRCIGNEAFNEALQPIVDQYVSTDYQKELFEAIRDADTGEGSGN